jgi:hypothetical protein
VQSQTVCPGLESCWGKLFPAVKSALSGSQAVVDKVIQEYEASAKNKILSLQNVEGQDWSDLSYESAANQSYLQDCEELRQAVKSKGPLDLIVVGQQYDEYKGAFDEVAKTYYAEHVAKRCGTLGAGTKAFTECKNNILVISQPGRERLYEFLRMLKPNSVSSFTYVGHGLRDQIVLGPRKLARYETPGVVSRKQWVKEDDGALYVDELSDGQPFAKALKTAFRPDAKIDLYACNTGQGFAGAFAKAAGVARAKASFVEMNYAIVDDQGKVLSMPSTAKPESLKNLASGEHLVLLPIRKGAFREVAAAAYKPTFSEAMQDHKADALERLSPENVNSLARSVFAKVSAGSGSVAQVQNPDGSISVVAFSPFERRKLKSIIDSAGPDLLKNASEQQLLGLLNGFNDEALKGKLQSVIDTETNTSAYGLVPSFGPSIGPNTATRYSK